MIDEGVRRQVVTHTMTDFAGKSSWCYINDEACTVISTHT